MLNGMLTAHADGMPWRGQGGEAAEEGLAALPSPVLWRTLWERLKPNLTSTAKCISIAQHPKTTLALIGP